MYKLHGVADWGSLVIHMALAELEVPFTFHSVDWKAGGLESPEHLALTPFSRIPVLETPEGPVFETAAILLYLTEKHGKLAPAIGAADRGAFLTWLMLVTNSVHPEAMLMLHPENAGGEAVAEIVADTTHARLRRHLGLLDGVAATGVWWLSPNQPSILSLFVAMLLRWSKAFPTYARHSIPSQDFPALHAMVAGLEMRPLIAAVLRAEGLSGPALSNPPCETAGG